MNFFFTSKGHSITQTWGGLGNKTGIEQPIKSNSQWNDLAVLAKKSEIWLRARGTWMMLKSGNHICSVYILSNSVAKLGQTWGSFIIAISSLQYVPKLWHVECWSMLSIPHHNASTSINFYLRKEYTLLIFWIDIIFLSYWILDLQLIQLIFMMSRKPNWHHNYHHVSFVISKKYILQLFKWFSINFRFSYDFVKIPNSFYEFYFL